MSLMKKLDTEHVDAQTAESTPVSASAPSLSISAVEAAASHFFTLDTPAATASPRAVSFTLDAPTEGEHPPYLHEHIASEGFCSSALTEGLSQRGWGDAFCSEQLRAADYVTWFNFTNLQDGPPASPSSARSPSSSRPMSFFRTTMRHALLVTDSAIYLLEVHLKAVVGTPKSTPKHSPARSAALDAEQQPVSPKTHLKRRTK
jgi:hypothetical protein